MQVKKAKNITSPDFEERPWGNYTVLDEGEGFKVKRIEILPEKRLSYQKHAHRVEHWQIVCGTAKVTLNGQETLVEKGGTVDIPLGTKHRVENPDADELLVFIEVQLGDYLGEDDIERFEDDFGRV
jgi:mannose-6-phosphate isomerase-like protein (cupin superfamily)